MKNPCAMPVIQYILVKGHFIGQYQISFQDDDKLQSGQFCWLAGNSNEIEKMQLSFAVGLDSYQ